MIIVCLPWTIDSLDFVKELPVSSSCCLNLKDQQLSGSFLCQQTLSFYPSNQSQLPLICTNCKPVASSNTHAYYTSNLQGKCFWKHQCTITPSVASTQFPSAPSSDLCYPSTVDLFIWSTDHNINVIFHFWPPSAMYSGHHTTERTPCDTFIWLFISVLIKAFKVTVWECGRCLITVPLTPGIYIYKVNPKWDE